MLKPDGLLVSRSNIQWVSVFNSVRNTGAVGISAASRHFIEVHQRDVQGFRFWEIERVYRGPRGGDMKRTLLKREAYWIFYGTLYGSAAQALIYYSPHDVYTLVYSFVQHSY